MIVPIAKKMFARLSVHWRIAAAGMLLTLIIYYPQFSFPLIAKEEYRGINIAHFGTDEHFYLARAKEALEGRRLGNPVLREGKDGQDTFFMYNERVMLSPFRLFGLAATVNVVDIYNWYNFIGIFILIILIYFFVRQLSGDTRLSVAAALFVVGGYSIVYNKTLFYADFNIYGRAMFPYVSSLAFFTYLNLLVKSVRSAKKIYPLLAGLSFGALFYVYFFAWSFAAAFTGVLLVIYLVRREYPKAANVALVMLLGIILGAYNMWKLFSYMNTESGRQLAYFQWSSHGRQFIFSKIGAVTLGLFSVYAWRRKYDEQLPFVLAITLAGWLALNQQMVTNRFVQYGHYYWYFIVPLSIVAGFYMVWSLVRQVAVRKALFCAVLAVAFLNTSVGQYRSSLTTLERKKQEQRFAPLIEVLRHKPYGVILAANSGYDFLFPIYTDDDVFWSPAAPTFGAPRRRMKDALYVYFYLNKEARHQLGDYIDRIMQDPRRPSAYTDLYENLEGYGSGYDYYEYQRRLAESDPSLLAKRPALVAELNREYQALIADPTGMMKLLYSYGVRYIVWDRAENPEWDLSVIAGLRETAVSHDIHLYEIVNASS